MHAIPYDHHCVPLNYRLIGEAAKKFQHFHNFHALKTFSFSHFKMGCLQNIVLL